MTETFEFDKKDWIPCGHCGKLIPPSEYNHPTGKGFCYDCWTNHLTDCYKLSKGLAEI